MPIKSSKIKNKILIKYENINKMFYPNDMIQLNNFDSQLLKINKRNNRENNNIYYISYKVNKRENRKNNNISYKTNKPEHDTNSIKNLYFVVDHLYGTIEKLMVRKIDI